MNRGKLTIGNLLKNRQVTVGGSVLIIFIILAVLAPYITPYELWRQDYTALLEPPSENHFFGTDQYGRDIFTRILYGGRSSLLAAFGAATLAGFIGIIMGLIAGYTGGKVDRIIQALINIFWSFPSLLLGLILVVVLQPGMFSIVIAISLGYWPQYAQVIRSEVISKRSEEFVEAARAIGANDIRILFRHIMPNVIAPVIVLGSLTMGYAIIVEASLSFLGLGIQPPMSSWGTMLSDAREYLGRAPWLSIFPGVAIALTVVALNLLGDGLRDILDPHIRNVR